MDGEWFFQTRDDDHGPFTRREAAEQALERFVEEKQATNEQRGFVSADHLATC